MMIIVQIFTNDILSLVVYEGGGGAHDMNNAL